MAYNNNRDVAKGSFMKPNKLPKKTKTKPDFQNKEPNAETIQAMKDTDNSKNLVRCKSLKDFYKKLGLKAPV